MKRKSTFVFSNCFHCFVLASKFSDLCLSCQGESGTAGENGAPGPMVSNIILISLFFKHKIVI